jgi:hypothetical protein
MKKIVILSDDSGRSFRWITLLKALFPECEIEIQIVSPDEKGPGSYAFGSLSEKSIINEIGR